MRSQYELHPGEFFLEKKVGGGAWTALSRDNDIDVMKTRLAYQIEMLRPGESVRLLDWKQKLLEERSL